MNATSNKFRLNVPLMKSFRSKQIGRVIRMNMFIHVYNFDNTSSNSLKCLNVKHFFFRIRVKIC